MSELEIETEDAACIILAGKNKPIVSINLDYISRKPRRKITVIGDKGNLLWDMQAKTLIIDTPTESKNFGGDFDVAASYITAMAEFLEAVKTGQATSQNLAEGLKTATLAIRAKEQ